LKKGGEGGFSVQDYFQNEFGNVSLTLTLPCSLYFLIFPNDLP